MDLRIGRRLEARRQSESFIFTQYVNKIRNKRPTLSLIWVYRNGMFIGTCVAVFVNRGLGIWCLMSLTTICQLYLDRQLYWYRKPEYQLKTSDLPQVTDKLYPITLYTLPWAMGFKFTTLVVMGTDCISSCTSNYHTITTTTAPHHC